jgi:hypothetical protein
LASQKLDWGRSLLDRHRSLRIPGELGDTTDNSDIRLIPVFHYALKPAGFLLLGSAENIGRYSNLFDVVAPKSKLFRRRPGDRRSPLIGGFAVPGPPSPPSFIIAFEPTPTATPTAAPEASDEGLRLRIGQLEEELVEFREHVQFPAGVVGRSCASWG